MSTRAMIGRKTAEGFAGRYHHWDGYPSGLGRALYELRNGHFHGDTAAMLAVLLDQHPAGWSTIVDRDFAQSPAWGSKTAPECLCHGGRHDPTWKVTQANAAGSGCEYAYVFDGDAMAVLSAQTEGRQMIGFGGYGDPDAAWVELARVDLNGPAPDWEAIERQPEPTPEPEPGPVAIWMPSKAHLFRLFELGQMVITPGAQKAVTDAGADLGELLARHVTGDWGDIPLEDKAANEQDLNQGGRLLSVYNLTDGGKIWIITEWDRSATTVLLPEEY